MRSSRYTRNIDLNQHVHTVSLCTSILSCQTRSSLAAVECKLPFISTSHGLSRGLCRCTGVGLLPCFGLSLHPRDSVAPDSQFRIDLRQNEKNITSWIIPAVDAGFSRSSIICISTQMCSTTNIKERSRREICYFSCGCRWKESRVQCPQNHRPARYP